MKKILAFAGVALWLPIGIANAQNPLQAPEVKEGLWEIHMQSTDKPGDKKTEGTSTICRNHAYDQHVQALAKDMKGCTKVNESFQGGKYSLEMHCTVGATVIDTKGTSTFQGDTATHSESHATYTPALYGVSETTMIQDQKYIGSCPADMQPGDRKSDDGKITHLWKH
jgi:hypothetical protein